MTALFIAGCQAPPPVYAEVRSEVFTPSCVFSSCHRGANPAGGLGLEGDAYEQLVGVVAAGAPSKTRVVPKDVAASFLVEKLETPSPSAGEQMPPDAPLEPERVELVKSWIRGGALRE
ncbi:MAG: hypothetical protein ACOZIN_16015 [Myxococcota bacterium]